MSLALHLKLAGLSLIALALSHLVLRRRFDWDEELARLSLLNRQIFLVHCFFLCLILVQMGVVSLVFTETLLVRTPLARLVLGGIASFWFIRLLFQFFVYDTALWRGNRFNTCVHIAASLLWLYYVAVFGGALFQQFS